MAISASVSGERRIASNPHPPDLNFRTLFDALPVAVYTTDAAGLVTYFNRAAVDFSGRTPILGEDHWCVTWRLHRPDGSVLPHEQCPMAVALREKRPVRDIQLVVERPDGSLLPALPFPTPLFDDAGEVIGAVNVIMDIGELTRAQAAVSRQADQQAALYRFTDRLFRAQNTGDIYTAALDAIVDGLKCSRASLLLFDEAGVMRFVASRGLSDAYRRAVGGHTPWKPGDRDAHPIVVDNILTSNESDELKAVVTREGISALSFIPLVEGNGVIGKFMAYYDEPHSFEPEELGLAITIARQLGFSIARERAEKARRTAEAELRQIAERLRLATEAGKVGLWDWDIESNQISWTDSLFAIHGMKKDQFDATFEDWLARVHPEDRPLVEQSIKDALDGTRDYEIELRTLRPDGEVVSIYTTAVVLREDGKPVRMVGASVDVTDRRKAEEQRAFLVAELSHRVKNNLTTVISIARQTFPRDNATDAARSAFEGRIRALAQTHTRLAEVNWQGVSLRTVVFDELAPYRHVDTENVRIDGPEISLPPKLAVTFGLAVHELATNAAKHGALSGHGTVDVGWEKSADSLNFVWREVGGPPVSPPTRNGFGRLLLEKAVAKDIQGSVDLSFDPSGVTCRIQVPLAVVHGRE